ncbi:MAG TPA: recombinase family protein [Terriglobales bacterium]
MTVIPAAQYVRMSTDDQQFSIANQRSRIADYAARHNFSIVHTYEDAGKSGVVIKRRRGLTQLLKDVVSGTANYKAILVYDVSRWGRFQNPDEAAHYEFMCENAGIHIHYCAEQFANDGTMPSSIMKALKRTMAAEYSRELSTKVFDGQKLIAEMGYRIGGTGLYGLRRMAISPTGKRKYFLSLGERKVIHTDRIILVPGRKNEVECVRYIFHAAAYEGKSIKEISQLLNSRGIKIRGHEWNANLVWHVLRNPQYAGYSVWNRTTQKMHTKRIFNPPVNWVMKANAFTPIVDDRTFKDAQKMLDKRRTVTQPDEVVLAKIKKLLTDKGELSYSIVKKSRGLFHPGQYYVRYGSYFKLYELLGYKPPAVRLKSQCRARVVRAVRKSLLEKVEQLFPDHVRTIRPSRYARKVLEIDSKFLVSVYICRQFVRPSGPLRWMLKAISHERENISLICLVDLDSEKIVDCYVRGPVGRSFNRRALCENDPWLLEGKKLNDLTEFYAAAVSCAPQLSFSSRKRQSQLNLCPRHNGHSSASQAGRESHL